MNYTELFNAFENNGTIHFQTEAVKAAETELSKALDGLDKATALKIDALIGHAIRAYEIQGFLYALNCTRILPSVRGAGLIAE